MLPSELKNTIEQFMLYVHRNETHLTYIDVYQSNVFEADNIYKNPPPNVISPIFCLLFLISLWGSIHDSAECWSAHRSPAAASNVCTTDARLGGVGRVPPPETKILATPVRRRRGRWTDAMIVRHCRCGRRRSTDYLPEVRVCD